MLHTKTIAVLGIVAGLASQITLSDSRADEVKLRDPAKVVAELPMTVRASSGVSAPVYINGRGPLDFVVDTGATTSGIWSSAVKQNSLRNKHVATINVSAADGIVRLRVLEFDAFRASVFALDPPELMEYPDYYSYYRRPLSGILGADYLMNHVVVFDFPRSMMVLYPKRTNLTRRMPRYFDSVPLKFRAGQNALLVRTRLNDKSIAALVDTGAIMTTILASEAARLGISLEGARRITMTGVNGNPVHGSVVTIATLKAGSKVWHDIDVVFAQFTVGRFDGFTMLLGMDLLGQTPFAIDYGRKRLLLAKPEKVKMVSRRDPRTQAIVSVPEELECSFPVAAREGLPWKSVV